MSKDMKLIFEGWRKSLVEKEDDHIILNTNSNSEIGFNTIKLGDTEIERRVSEMDNPIEEKTAFLSEFNLVAKAGQFHLVERSKANADSVEISHFSAVL